MGPIADDEVAEVAWSSPWALKGAPGTRPFVGFGHPTLVAKGHGCLARELAAQCTFHGEHYDIYIYIYNMYMYMYIYIYL